MYRIKTTIEKVDMARQAVDMEQRTNIPARQDDLNATYFKPMHRPATERRDTYHVK